MKTSLMWTVIAPFALVGLANADTKDPGIGTILKAIHQVVDVDNPTASQTTLGKDRTYSYVDRLEHTHGKRLGFQDENRENHSAKPSRHVTPETHALDFLTNYFIIKNNWFFTT